MTKEVEGGVSEEVLRNRENLGFWSRQRSCRTRPEPWPREKYKEDCERRRLEVILFRNREAKRKFQLNGLSFGLK
jgi:hypothetical protein